MPSSFQHLLIGAACLLAALLAGVWVATGSYIIFILLAALCASVATVVAPGYSFLIALGLICPLSISLPFVSSVPLLGLMLMLSCLKNVLRKPFLTKQEEQPLSAFSLLIRLFFAGVLFRYCLNPVGPGIALGLSEGVTGFRAYLNYFLCFLLLFVIGRIFSTRLQLIRLVRWMGIIALGFASLLILLTFTRSLVVAEIMSNLGLFVSAFDNGLLRFVTLSEVGVFLVLLSCLPKLFPVKKAYQLLLFLFGFVAVILGGNRSSLGEALAILCVIPLLKKRYYQWVLVGSGIGLVLITTHFVGETMGSRTEYGLLRFMSLTSSRVAHDTGAADTAEWRQIRWSRAWDEIIKNPWIGHSYGGLGSAFVWGTEYGQFEEERQQIDLATGGVHNGYLSCALALGIPMALLFLFIVGSQLLFNWRRARGNLASDPVLAELHCLSFAGLIGVCLWIYIGTDLNAPIVWFYLGLGGLAAGIKHREARSAIASHSARVVPAAVTMAKCES